MADTFSVGGGGSMSRFMRGASGDHWLRVDARVQSHSLLKIDLFSQPITAEDIKTMNGAISGTIGENQMWHFR